MTGPEFVDDRLVDGWMAALALPTTARIPGNLVDRWRLGLLAAVREAREPAPIRLTGRFAALDRYLTGVAAGLAAGLGTSPASDAGESDPIILAAGLLAGSAALQAPPEADRYEVAAGRAAAAAVVDNAAGGAGLITVINAAARAAAQVRPRALVSIALGALAQSVSPTPAAAGHGELYQVSLLVEPPDPRVDLDNVALDHALDGLTADCRWRPDETGFRLVISTTQPGAVVEAVWSYGRVSDLRIRYLPG